MTSALWQETHKLSFTFVKYYEKQLVLILHYIVWFEYYMYTIPLFFNGMFINKIALSYVYV